MDATTLPRRRTIRPVAPLFILPVCLYSVIAILFDQYQIIQDTTNTREEEGENVCHRNTSTTMYSLVTRREKTFTFPNDHYLLPIGFHNTSDTAVCDFIDFTHARHFPHALQFLLRCWSFWKVHADKEPVLRFSPRGPHPRLKRVPKYSNIKRILKGKRKIIRFLDGFILDLESLGATLIMEREPLVSEQEAREHEALEPPYIMRHPDDARTLATHIQELHSISDHPVCQTTRPVVGVLNRASASLRSLLNVDEIVLSLQRAGYVVETTQFEGAPYHSQVDFFSRIDLLVTPHGAQNTGLFFMGTCGGVLEIFPDTYYLPDFFGSLAETSDVSYYAMLLSNASNVTAKKDPLQWSRSVQLCPNVDDIAEAIRAMTNDWKMCCGNSTTATDGGTM